MRCANVLDLLDSSTLKNESEKTLSVHMLWSIWLSRNAVVMGNEDLSIRATIVAALSLMEAFKNVSNPEKLVVDSQAAKVIRWNPHKIGVLKINVDASYVDGESGVGVLIRDWKGDVVVALSKKMGKVLSVEQAELGAIRIGVIEALKINSDIIEVESDLSLCIARINTISEDLTTLCAIAKDIKDSSTLFDKSKFSHICRPGNTLAHLLASVGLKENCNWRSSPHLL